MATRSKSAKPRKTAKAALAPRFQPLRWLMRWLWRVVFVAAALVLLMALLYKVVNPPTTLYMLSEGRRLGADVDQKWVPADRVAPVMLRSVVAAEDANFCTHWGFDMNAIRDAIEGGGARGASTLTQQVVKNAYLWQGRTYTRKALEALITPVVEGVWSKRRILEVYLNIAEFDEGVFGVEAAAYHYFGVGPDALSPTQAARLAAILPNPKGRSAANPSNFVRRRAASIRDGAATIARDGRAACFEPG
ncbi:monofunctional biosynthetic peptidoglycan transglycosylase [Puniceibacterium sp. IMCC21224]|uniref:monofunctional biosynthetic peptidoglycan transglycosylase n=1 Tax=Puniceibacterium sp. IMCC21224 TaxID=1618204 RepID=UPI00064DC8D4|nr:monofunctional biosynthetic peptidoglycan transglycosylase [Puniceibacterium sp. IMCC21224]KMK66407.1 monofunctional biosynthetic peptidoglycan transglycosylase [Puniceibacterium sp. IMCC21224]